MNGLNGFNQAIEAVYPKAEVQGCIVHQIRSSLRFVSWKDKKAVAKSWHNHWSELSIFFFKYLQSVRTLIYTTNPIEPLNAIIKKKTKPKGSFPTQGSALKVVYLAT